MPSVSRTYAPIGQTPILKEKFSREHISAISVITPDGQLYLNLQEQSYKGPDVVEFLKVVLKSISDKIMLLWDRSPIHRADVVKDFLRSVPDELIHLEFLPAYAPELNPDEGVWNNIKSQLRNSCCFCLTELRQKIFEAKAALVERKDVIFSFFKHAGLY